MPVTNIEQPSVLALHRVRPGLVKARTAQAQRIRGRLGKFGLIIRQGVAHIAKPVAQLIDKRLQRAERLISLAGAATDGAPP